MGRVKLSDHQKLVRRLVGKTIVATEISDSSLELTLHDKTVVRASAESGSGLDGNWYNSTKITVGGVKVVDK